jgi:ferredoxin
MFFQYNRAAGGHNPRDMHWKRMRQRMLHKFCYFVEKYGDIDCVGCGRCIRSCPVSYDIRDFIKKSFMATGGMIEQAPIEQASEASTQDDMAAVGVASTGTANNGVDNASLINEDAQGENAADGFAAALPSENEEPFICDVKIDVGQNIDSSETSKLDMKEPVTQNPVIENLVEESSMSPVAEELADAEPSDANYEGTLTQEAVEEAPIPEEVSASANVAVDVFKQKPIEIVSIFPNNYDFDEDETVDEPVLGDEKAQHDNENKVTGEGSDV